MEKRFKDLVFGILDKIQESLVQSSGLIGMEGPTLSLLKYTVDKAKLRPNSKDSNVISLSEKTNEYLDSIVMFGNICVTNEYEDGIIPISEIKHFIGDLKDTLEQELNQNKNEKN